MNGRICAVIAVSFVFCAGLRGAAGAQGAEGVKEKAAAVSEWIIGSTFQASAKAYIFAVDLEKVKKSNIDKINQMDDDSFRIKYAGMLRMIAESPDLEKKFGLNWMMDRREAINQIEGLTKERLNKIVDAIPDKVIASSFSRFMSARMEEMKGKDLMQRINHVWNSIVRKIEK